MSDLAGYKEWLSKLQRKPAFINNYWCAMLAQEMKDGMTSESFKIPYFIVEEELGKEDNNHTNEDNNDVHVSVTLRLWLVHLLKEYNEEASVLNYEEVLREFLERDNILPVGIARPLTPSTSFHNLPTDCKLWILHALKTHKKGSSNLKTLTKDPLGNTYHIVPDCRLYVRIVKSDNIVLSIEEENVAVQPWGPLYRYIHNHPCKLLCENQDSWEDSWKKVLSFKMNNLYNALRPTMTIELAGLSSVLMGRAEQRREFDEQMNKLTPVPVPRAGIANKKKRTSVADALVKKVEAINLTDLNALEDIAPPTEVNDSSQPIMATEEVKPKPRPKRRMEKCWQFPQCPLDNRCPYVHPRLPCTKFPNCPRGWQCLFLHEVCYNDADCTDANCAYEHVISKPTYYRQDVDSETPRPIAAVPPFVQKVSDEEAKLGDDTPKATSTPTAPEKIKKRCQYFPQCERGDACRYIHPAQFCRNFPVGKKCPGQWCLYKHGNCPNDGTCTDLKCAYEHVKSPPVIVRKHAQKKNPNEGSLSRATSFSNLSTCSGGRVGRRRSVTFEVDSDNESRRSSPERKESSTNKPPGILRSPGNRKQCRFGASCTNEHCDYAHDLEKCPAFPKCPNGGKCFFLHEVCENDGICSKENCDYKHNKPHDIGNKWCRNGSRCTRLGCKFIHPKECIRPCPTPGDCWMYHRPAPAPSPVPGFGPGYQAGHGFGLMSPPPDFVYRLPPPPALGFGGVQMGFPPGPGVFPGYGPGPFTQRYSNRSPVPPRPSTPGFSPSSDNSKISKEKSEESTRL